MKNKLTQHSKWQWCTIIRSFYLQGTMAGLSWEYLIQSLWQTSECRCSSMKAKWLAKGRERGNSGSGFELFWLFHPLSWSRLGPLPGDHTWYQFLIWHFIPLYSILRNSPRNLTLSLSPLTSETLEGERLPCADNITANKRKSTLPLKYMILLWYFWIRIVFVFDYFFF